MTWYDAYIERVPGVQGGEPVICGTRTPVLSIVRYMQIHSGDVQEVLDALPYLSVEKIAAAVAYYREHTAEIEADAEAHERAARHVRQA